MLVVLLRDDALLSPSLLSRISSQIISRRERFRSPAHLALSRACSRLGLLAVAARLRAGLRPIFVTSTISPSGNSRASWWRLGLSLLTCRNRATLYRSRL